MPSSQDGCTCKCQAKLPWLRAWSSPSTSYQNKDPGPLPSHHTQQVTLADGQQGSYTYWCVEGLPSSRASSRAVRQHGLCT